MTFEEAENLFGGQEFVRVWVRSADGTTLAEFGDGKKKENLLPEVSEYFNKLPNGKYHLVLKRAHNQSPEEINIHKGNQPSEQQTYQVMHGWSQKDLKPFLEEERQRMEEEYKKKEQNLKEYIQTELEKKALEKEKKEVEAEKKKLEDRGEQYGVVVNAIIDKLANKFTIPGMAQQVQKEQPTNEKQEKKLFEGIFTDNELQNLDSLFRAYPSLKDDVVQFAVKRFQELQNQNSNEKT
jgi:hypothetical protein